MEFKKSFLERYEKLTDINEKFEYIDNFTSSNLYETDEGRNYVLVSEAADYRLDICTDNNGCFTSLAVTYLKNEEGIYSYLNFMKLISKKINEKA